MMPHRPLREACCEANRLLAASGLVDLTFGNVSVADREEGIFAIKPSGVAYADLTPQRMVVLDFEGRVLAGELRPSSDTPTHRCLYRAFASAGAIVHTHSRHAVAFAQAGREIPCLGTTHADYFLGPVPVTRALTPEEIANDYEWNTGEVIVEWLSGMNPAAMPAVLVRHHGPFCWASCGPKAVETAQALELVAKMAQDALALNAAGTAVPQPLMDKHFWRKHGSNAYYGQTRPVSQKAQ